MEKMQRKEIDGLATLYTEAWKQYSHEDNLYQNRSNLFLGLNSAFIAALGIAIANVSITSVQIYNYMCPIYLLLTAIATGILARPFPKRVS